MSEFDGFDSSLPVEPDKGPLTDEENQELQELMVTKAADLKLKVPSAPDITEGEERKVLPELPVGRPAPPLEEYVAAHVEACRLAINAGLKNPIHRGDDRLARAEAYARWRWQGYVDGVVVSL
jgi:hypothetical protein